MRAFYVIGSAVFIMIVLSIGIDVLRGDVIDLNNYYDEAILGAAIGIYFYFKQKKKVK